MAEHRILVSIPEPLRSRLLTAETLAKLHTLAHLTLNEEGRNWSAEELARHLPGHDVLLASWGLARLTPEVLQGADRLRLVAYAAGSVKGFATDALFERGIIITHAAARIADSVAEMALLLALVGLRRVHEFDRRMKSGELWPKDLEAKTFEIRGKRVGLLGMGYVGQRTARLFQAVGAEVWCYDPYLSPSVASALGVRQATLDELLSQCPIVSVHLPITEETHHLIGARELALLQDGALFINTARAWVVDGEALLCELETGRIWAALDVFDEEPLPLDSPLRRLENVLLTPHVAGQTVDSYQGLGECMAREIERFFHGQPLQYSVSREALARMA